MGSLKDISLTVTCLAIGTPPFLPLSECLNLWVSIYLQHQELCFQDDLPRFTVSSLQPQPAATNVKFIFRRFIVKLFIITFDCIARVLSAYQTILQFSIVRCLDDGFNILFICHFLTEVLPLNNFEYYCKDHELYLPFAALPKLYIPRPSIYHKLPNILNCYSNLAFGFFGVSC